MKKNTAPKPIFLRDYQPPFFSIEKANLCFDLDLRATRVESILTIRRNGNHQHPLVLDGDALKLVAIALNNENLSKQGYKLDSQNLTVYDVPDRFVLKTEVVINPLANTELDGFFVSHGIFCTQCEPHGFRRITFFIDRPDVMTKFTTTIRADRTKYPILLSNGNPIAKGRLKDDRHYVTWEDPSVKSCYLLALVAGNLEFIADKFITKSGKEVALKIFCEQGQKSKCYYALDVIKRAMRWDEEKFGCEYDLDIFMLVAINDFNAGAMENKGLNIFNAANLLADPKTTTDTNYQRIESVVAHEYFHNWTGNRITCRDWFQLCIKEGLTVFREQLFMADQTSAAIARIKDARFIRTMQFVEDAGPLAHPVQLDSFIEINNFYTFTVYEKGAEIIHMLLTLLGEKVFFQGLTKYFSKHDGCAVTVEDFIMVMQEVTKIDLKQFSRWYHRAGTPVLKIKSEYSQSAKSYSLTVTQDHDFCIPLAVGFLDKSGKDMRLQLQGETSRPKSDTRVLIINRPQQIFKFLKVSERPILSLLRNFSAPVKIEYQYSDKELLFLLRYDSDLVSRYDACQQFAVNIILYSAKSAEFIEVLREILRADDIDDDFKTILLTMPDYSALMDEMETIDVARLYRNGEKLKKEIASSLYPDFLQNYQQRIGDKAYTNEYQAMAKRGLKNLCLYYLVRSGKKDELDLCWQQFKSADNMTDYLASVLAITDFAVPEREKMFIEFYQQWQGDDLVIAKWLEMQAISSIPNALANIKRITKLPIFKLTNPNKVYSLLRAFCRSNLLGFHAANGEGYKFIVANICKLDRINPMLAANLARAFVNWRKFKLPWKKLMQEQLKVLAASSPSKNLYEVVHRALSK